MKEALCLNFKFSDIKNIYHMFQNFRKIGNKYPKIKINYVKLEACFPFFE